MDGFHDDDDDDNDYGSDYDYDYDGYEDSLDAWDSDVDYFYSNFPSHLRDYHPSWKKYKKTLLDVYIVAKKTRELLDFFREDIMAKSCTSFDEHMETILKEIETIGNVSKKRSITKLSKVLGLPDLAAIEKIFGYIEESYNTHFDRHGPEEVTWMLEDQDDEVAEACYSTISDHYEFILCVMYPYRMTDFGFDASEKTFCHGDNEDDDKAFYHGDDDDDDKAFYHGDDDDDDDKTISHGDGSGNCLSKSSQLKLAVAQLCGDIEDII